MSGRYERAPLVYVSAQVRTSGLPSLTEDQQISLHQQMVQIGLPTRKETAGQILSVDVDPVNQEVKSTSRLRPSNRYGFFNADASECLIIDDTSIEFRTTKYLDYDHLCDKMIKYFEGVFEKIDFYKHVIANELVLNYVDLILPYSGKSITDFFSTSSALPLNFLGNKENDDLQRVGAIEVSRVVTSNQKVNITLEQLPLINGNVPKFLPNAFIEFDPAFSMPLEVKALGQELTGDQYALLLTQSMRKLGKELGEVKVKDDFEPLHAMTKETLKSIIDENVCNEVWGYKEEKSYA